MKFPILCFLALLTTLNAENLLSKDTMDVENLFSNGTMDTAGGWKGSKKMVEEKENGKPNRYLKLGAKKSDPVTFSQEVDSKGLFAITLKFRYRTKDYHGLGLELRGIRTNNGFTYTNRELVADGKWHVITWDFNQITGSKKINFSINLLQGEGEVFFDDFSAVAAK